MATTATTLAKLCGGLIGLGLSLLWAWVHWNFIARFGKGGAIVPPPHWIAFQLVACLLGALLGAVAGLACALTWRGQRNRARCLCAGIGVVFLALLAALPWIAVPYYTRVDGLRVYLEVLRDTGPLVLWPLGMIAWSLRRGKATPPGEE